nr:MAG: hypothetical protein [Crogonang virus 172]
MTSNQLTYQANLERERSNRAQEAERNRSNLANEANQRFSNQLQQQRNQAQALTDYYKTLLNLATSEWTDPSIINQYMTNPGWSQLGTVTQSDLDPWQDLATWRATDTGYNRSVNAIGNTFGTIGKAVGSILS